MGINIKYFFIFVFVALSSILYFLEPKFISLSVSKEMPRVVFQDFELYDLNTSGVKSIMTGTLAKNFANYTTINNMNYFMNNAKMTTQVLALKAKYEKPYLYFSERVYFIRNDGLKLTTEKAQYNEKKKQFDVLLPYTLEYGYNQFSGKSLHYDMLNGKMYSKNIEVRYEF
jgi:LPS export ABC transporter protein LptC